MVQVFKVINLENPEWLGRGKESDLVRGVFLREKTVIGVGRAEHYAPWGNTAVAWSSVWGGHLHRRFTVGKAPFLSSTHQLNP